MKKNILLTVCFLLMFTFSGNSAWAQPKTIQIGWIGPLTGPAAEYGIALRQGSVLALDEWNSNGGVYVKEYGKKIPIEIIFGDCQSKPEIGVSVAEKFVMANKVHMILGDALHSHVTMALMELAPKYGIPIMSLEPSSPEISKKIAKDVKRYWSFWKGDFSGLAYSKAMFQTYQYFVEQGALKPKTKTIASIGEDTDYGRVYAGNTHKFFEEIGWKVVALEAVPIGHTDFYPQLSKIKALDPDIFATYFTSVASGIATAKQFHEVGLKSMPFACLYPLRPEFIAQAGKAAEYLVWTPLLLDEKVPAHKVLVDKIKKQWNASATADHIYGYDGLYNALHSIEQAGSLNPKKIIDALSKLDRKGTLGRWVFDQSNHEIKDGPDYIPIPVAQILDGKSSIIWPPNVATTKFRIPQWVK
ncbi:MAG: ABC transporter substrate-binding protein [Thermodesulfobacteriota bacterium]